MSWGKNNGPREVVIPEQRYMSCGGCKYYNHKMVRSGLQPEFVTFCNHPSFEEYANFFQKVRELSSPFQEMRTPEWCPFIVAPPRIVLIEKYK